MADEKTTKNAPAKSNETVILPPKKVFRWADSDRVTGKLTAPIVCVEEKFGKRTRIALDSATVLIPSRYATPYAVVPVGATVTIVKSGAGRDTEYVLSHS